MTEQLFLITLVIEEVPTKASLLVKWVDNITRAPFPVGPRFRRVIKSATGYAVRYRN